MPALHGNAIGLAPSDKVWQHDSVNRNGNWEFISWSCVLCRYFREGYLNAMAELIQRELQKFDSPEKTEIFFSAHGVPVSYVEQVRLRVQRLLL